MRSQRLGQLAATLGGSKDAATKELVSGGERRNDTEDRATTRGSTRATGARGKRSTRSVEWINSGAARDGDRATTRMALLTRRATTRGGGKPVKHSSGASVLLLSVTELTANSAASRVNVIGRHNAMKLSVEEKQLTGVRPQERG